MGYEAKKTEHAGAKHGNGAYWGPKKDAKRESSKLRRRNWKREVSEHLRKSNEEYLAGKSRAIEDFLSELKADKGKKAKTARR